ncbi:MAG: YCF48-related protein [Bacteroidales bacterium]
MKFNLYKIKLKQKKIHCIIALFLCSIGLSLNAQHTDWHLLPFVPRYHLVDIYCVNKDTVIAVGANGYVIRTTNGGNNWDTVFSTTKNHLNKIMFLDDFVGYICGDKGAILRTENSGLTWTNISIFTSLNLLSMSFINQDTGWIVGGNGVCPYHLYDNKGILIKTNDGGRNWLIDTNYNSVISSVCFLNNDTGYITINSQFGNFILKTQNGGLTFDTIQKNTKDLYYYGIYNVKFINPKTGYCLMSANDEGIYKTEDYGKTWNKIIELYYPIVNMDIIDSCNLYFSNWDNTVSNFYSMPFIGINYCEDFQFDQQNLTPFSFDFLTNDYGFSIEDVGSHIYKKDVLNPIREYEYNKIQIFPNPLKDKIFIKQNDLKNHSITLKIYTVLGQLVFQKEYVKISDIETIDLSFLPNGIYTLNTINNNRIIQTNKLIKL